MEDYRRLPKTFEEDSESQGCFDHTLTKLSTVTGSNKIGEDVQNTPFESRIWFRMNFTSGVFSSRTLKYI